MWSTLGTSCAHVEPMLGICWPMLAYAGLGRDCVGHMLAYVSPMLAYVGTILVHLGGYARHMLGICWGGYYLVPIPSPCSLLGRRPAVRRKPHK